MQWKWRRPALFMLLAVAALMLASGPRAVAQTYPTKPVRLILPFAGGSELIGRMVAGKLSPVLGQQIVPDPRFGAAGNIGWEAAAKAPADGYTLVVGAVPVLTNRPQLPEGRLRPAEELRADLAHRVDPEHPARASVRAGENPEGTDPARAWQSGQDRVWLGRCGLGESPRGGVPAIRGEDPLHACSL